MRGNVTSNATLTVNQYPSILHHRPTIRKTARPPLAFTISDAETAAGSLTLQGWASDPVLVPTNNIVFGGSDGNRTVTVTPAANLSGFASIFIKVTDGNGASTTGGFSLTVTVLNDAPAGTDKTISINEDTSYTFAAADFGFSVSPLTPSAGEDHHLPLQALTLNGRRECRRLCAVHHPSGCDVDSARE